MYESRRQTSSEPHICIKNMHVADIFAVTPSNGGLAEECKYCSARMAFASIRRYPEGLAHNVYPSGDDKEPLHWTDQGPGPFPCDNCFSCAARSYRISHGQGFLLGFVSR